MACWNFSFKDECLGDINLKGYRGSAGGGGWKYQECPFETKAEAGSLPFFKNTCRALNLIYLVDIVWIFKLRHNVSKLESPAWSVVRLFDFLKRVSDILWSIEIKSRIQSLYHYLNAKELIPQYHFFKPKYLKLIFMITLNMTVLNISVKLTSSVWSTLRYIELKISAPKTFRFWKPYDGLP